MHHDAAVPDDRADGGVGLVVQGHVPLGFRHIGAQRPTHLHRFDGATAAAAAAKVEQQFAQAQAKGALHQAAVSDVARQLERQGAGGATHAEVFVESSAFGQDEGHAGQGDHVVDHGGLAEQTLDGRQWGLGPHDAAFAFDALEHGGFFAAHIRARGFAHLQRKGPATAHDIASQEARRFAQRNRLRHGGDGVRVFGADVDKTLCGAHRQTRDDHALDQHEGVALEGHAVGERARVAFVGITDHVLLSGLGAKHRAPFDAGRKGRATATPQARVQHGLNHRFAGQRQRLLQALPAAVCGVVLQRQWACDAHARKRQALLLGQKRNLFGGAQTQRVCSPVQDIGGQERGDVFGSHGAIGDAALLGLYLQQRLQPEQATRAVALHVQDQATRGGLVL